MTSNSLLDEIKLRETLSLRRDAEKIINESLPTTSTRQNYFPIPTPHMKHPSSGSAKIPSFDVYHIPTSQLPSELYISALSEHQIKGEALDNLRQIISDTIIPTSWTRVPFQMGSPSHGSSKDAEWALLYKVYIHFLMLSQQSSLYEHNSPNMQRKMVKSEDLENESTKNTFHLISAIKIATSWTVSMDDVAAFSENWKTFCISNQNLFP
ncbi:hypothetical protein O181_072447 [Austropuccinia psidii MF-1]|uniref:Uncharacterized protein n=1 Tax=Austropuccinia psidii MF-1 TaxID=1389203 RepID=A0A9Q3F760_9BASI|nr:hypothetical protein [Austropuccinia psidii MF-1]